MAVTPPITDATGVKVEAGTGTTDLTAEATIRLADFLGCEASAEAPCEENIAPGAAEAGKEAAAVAVVVAAAGAAVVVGAVGGAADNGRGSRSRGTRRRGARLDA